MTSPGGCPSVAPAQTLFRPRLTYTLASNPERRWGGGGVGWETEAEPGWGTSSYGHSAVFVFDGASFWLSNREAGSAQLPWTRRCARRRKSALPASARGAPLPPDPKAEAPVCRRSDAPVTCPLSRAWGGGSDPRGPAAGAPRVAPSPRGLRLARCEHAQPSTPRNLLPESCTREGTSRAEAGGRGGVGQGLPSELVLLPAPAHLEA